MRNASQRFSSQVVLLLLVGVATTGPKAIAAADETIKFPYATGAETKIADAKTAEVKAFKPEELEALASPIALYPDSLVAQVLMASTYPLEIVQADRWVQSNKELKDPALTTELEKKDWDPSVKSLINFPQVLTMMSTQLDWTTKLGDAFIADQKSVMAAVQKLRAKAQAEGNLKTTKEQKVVVEKAEQTQTVVVQGETPPPQIIKIESASPEVVYVPTYNPAVVYGAWPYPTYPPPAPYYPPGYVASNLLSFGAGVAIGAAWGHAWGGCNWHGGEVDIDVNRNTEFNRNINSSRESYKQNMQQRSANRTGTGTGGRQGGANGFQHDPSHRKGVSYRDNATAKAFDRSSNAGAAQARDSFRGRAEAGRQDIARGGADSFRGNAGVSNQVGSAGGLGDRAGSGALSGRSPSANPSVANRGTASPGGGATRAPSSVSRGSAFDGARTSGSSTRSYSDRGAASRSSPARSSGGVSRGGGGGARGGGGGRR